MLDNWIEAWYYQLDCMQKRNKTEIEKNYDPSDTKYLLPHEFLFFLCNTVDRIEHIKKTKTGPSLALNK